MLVVMHRSFASSLLAYLRQTTTLGVFSASCFILAALFSHWPWSNVALLMMGSLILALLDVCAGQPFMTSVKPLQHKEMSAVYSSFRDVSGIVSAAIACVVLQFSRWRVSLR